METPEILTSFGDAGLLPVEAIRAARERKAELVPLFTAVLEDCAASRFDLEARPDLPFFAFHLLGEWQETSACAALIRFLRAPGTGETLGDATTVTAHRVLAGVFDGDTAALFGLVLDSQADQFLRSRACEAVAMLVHRGRMARAEAVEFLRGCFEAFQREARPPFVWNGWENAIAMLALDELVPLVEEAFAQRLIDPRWMALRHFEEDFAQAKAGAGGLTEDEYRPFDDAIVEFATWDGFSEVYTGSGADARAGAAEDEWESPWLLAAPVVNPQRHIGRNDPCPCGSGRKFKKCCLAQAA